MVQLLYGTTSLLVVTVTERYFGSVYYLYLAENFNAWPTNPPSSNPFQLFLDYQEIVRTNDRMNPKFVLHRRGIRFAIRTKLGNRVSDRQMAMGTVQAVGIHGIQPYLALLDRTAYESRSGRLSPIPPPLAGSPTSVEYLLRDIHGPAYQPPELHLQKLHF